MTALTKQHLGRASLQMKQQANKGWTERESAVGDLVFLRIQPYVQSSLAPRANKKLAFKYFWAFSGTAEDWVGGVQIGPAITCQYSYCFPCFVVEEGCRL
jgi:hypothetical protein